MTTCRFEPHLSHHCGQSRRLSRQAAYGGQYGFHHRHAHLSRRNRDAGSERRGLHTRGWKRCRVRRSASAPPPLQARLCCACAIWTATRWPAEPSTCIRRSTHGRLRARPMAAAPPAPCCQPRYRLPLRPLTGRLSSRRRRFPQPRQAQSAWPPPATAARFHSPSSSIHSTWARKGPSPRSASTRRCAVFSGLLFSFRLVFC